MTLLSVEADLTLVFQDSWNIENQFLYSLSSTSKKTRGDTSCLRQRRVYFTFLYELCLSRSSFKERARK